MVPPGWFVYVLLVAAKIWLTRAQSLLAIGDSPGDDRLYLELANHLARGAWLGRYNSLTLVKVPFYPMWVAATFGLGVPLLLAQQLLYVASCVAAVVALRPVITSRVARLGLFALLLWNPWSFADGVMTRAAREGIYASLAILVFAGAVGLALRQEAPRSTLVRWALLLGASAAALWMTREEGVWVVPMIGLGLCAGGLRTPSWRRLVWGAALALFVWWAAVGFVLWRNANRYGMAVLSEETNGPFVEAFRQMVRVRPSQWRRSVPLPRESREKLYAASPAFARLRNYLEGPDQPNWVAIGCNVYGLCDEIGAGAIHWAIREAAAHEDVFRTGATARQYWLQVAHEIDDACRRQALSCDPLGAGNAVLDGWRAAHWHFFWASLGEGLSNVLRAHGVRSTPTPSVGPLSYLDIFRDLTRERLAGLDAQVRTLRGSVVIAGTTAEFVALELRSSRGTPAEGDIHRSTPPGADRTRADTPATFNFRAYCPDGCSLLVTDLRNAQPRGTVPLKSDRVLLGGLELRINAEPDPSLPRQERLDARRLMVLDGITSFYRFLLPLAALLGALAWLVAGILSIRLRGARASWLTCSVALVGFGTRMVLLAIVSAVAFPSMNVLYVSPAPPLLLLFCGLALVSAARAAELARVHETVAPAVASGGPGLGG